MERSHDLNNWANKIKGFWESEGIKIEEGAIEKKIFESEKILGLSFPPSFTALYKQVNGFRDYDWNRHMFSIWPLDRILKEHTESKDKLFVGFCDFLINSHCIGFSKGATGIFKDYDQESPITATFEQAIDLINNNSDLIY